MTKLKVRSLMSSAAYASAAELVQSLKSKLRDLDTEESRLLDPARFHTPTAGAPQNANVAALLGEEAPDAPVNGHSARLSALAAERRDVRAALAIAIQRQAGARQTASAPIVAEVGPEYRRRVKATAHALIAAHKSNAELVEMVDAMNAAGLEWSALKPMNAAGVFGPSTKLGPWLQEAVREGFIQQSELPREYAQ